MSIAKFIVDMLVYSDSLSTNDPQQRIWDYKKQVDTTVSNSISQVLVLPSATVTVISIPTSPKWIYLETDQQVKLRFSGDVADLVDVSPSAALVSDGMFFKRGVFTSLSINVPGATAANVKIYIGS